jgi:hypothetical protein
MNSIEKQIKKLMSFAVFLDIKIHNYERTDRLQR